MGHTTSKVLVAAGAGLALGAAMGILFAPAKGAETRTAIKDKASDLSQAAKEKINAIDVTAAVENMKASIQTEFKDSKESARASLLAKIEKLETMLRKS